MFGGFRRKPEVEMVTPPAEPALTGPAAERRIRQLDERVFIARRVGDMRRADDLLDQRNEIRPPRPAPVPVIPGRSS